MEITIDQFIQAAKEICVQQHIEADGRVITTSNKMEEVVNNVADWAREDKSNRAVFAVVVDEALSPEGAEVGIVQIGTRASLCEGLSFLLKNKSNTSYFPEEFIGSISAVLSEMRRDGNITQALSLIESFEPTLKVLIENIAYIKSLPRIAPKKMTITPGIIKS